MIDIGKTTTLKVIKHVEFGVYLDTGDDENILLPEQYLPEDPEEWQIDAEIEVFIYLDSEDRPVATTEIPYVEVGECAKLKVIGQSDFGTFLDWGLSKDLLVPFKEQRVPMEDGRSYVVYAFLDKSGRIAATSKLSRHLKEYNDNEFEPRQEVELLIASRSDLGFKAVINETHLGLIHNNEIVRPIKIGDRFTGFIGETRKDKRINITLQKLSYQVRHELSEQIIDYIEEQGGTITLTDKSSPAEIHAIFHVSKSNYKKALGKLLKEEKIIFHNNKVKLLRS